MRKLIKIALAACCAVLGGGQATAQSYPSKPLRLIVPFAVGGPVDGVARILAQKLGENLGQNVLVENRTGASGNIGTEYVVRSAADGYTLLWGVMSSMTVSPNLYKKLPYDTVTDLVPIILTAKVPNVLLLHPSVPAKSLQELVTYAKANPGKLTFASAGVGSSAHLSAELMKSVTGMNIVHVPYKGTSQVYPDLISGQVHMLFDAAYVAAPRVKNGDLRALAIADTSRATALPEVPTMAEAGAPGVAISSWYGFLAPSGTPQAIVARLNAEVLKILQSPDTLAKFSAMGVVPLGGTPEDFAAHIKSDLVKWAKVINDNGIRLE